MERIPERGIASEMTILYKIDCIPCGINLGEVEQQDIESIIKNHTEGNKKPHNVITPFSRYVNKNKHKANGKS